MSLTDIVQLSLQEACDLYRRGQFLHHLESYSVHELVKMYNNQALDVQNSDNDTLEVFEADDALEVFEDALER